MFMNIRVNFLDILWLERVEFRLIRRTRPQHRKQIIFIDILFSLLYFDVLWHMLSSKDQKCWQRSRKSNVIMNLEF